VGDGWEGERGRGAMNATFDWSASRGRRLAGAAGLALLASLPTASTRAETPVTAAIIGISVSIWPAIVADEKGFFAAEGVKVDFISAGASARSLQQVAAGSAEIGSSSMVDTIRGIGGGANVKIFLNTLAVPPPHP